MVVAAVPTAMEINAAAAAAAAVAADACVVPAIYRVQSRPRGIKYTADDFSC